MPRFLSKQESTALLPSELRWDEESLFILLSERAEYRAQKRDSGTNNWLARTIAASCRLPAQVVVVEHQVWPSSDNPPLFALVREAMGETANAYDRPAAVFAGGEENLLASYLAVVLHNLYDVVLYEAGEYRVWRFSHDEAVYCLVDDPEARAEVGQIFHRREG